MNADRGPYWGIAETLAWIAYSDRRAVDLVTDLVDEAFAGTIEYCEESPQLLELIKGRRGENGLALYPLIEFEDAVGLLIRACRQQQIVAEARGVKTNKKGIPVANGPWGTVPVEAWHDGQVSWLDCETMDGYSKRRRAFLFVGDGRVRTAFRFSQAEIKAMWPADETARMPGSIDVAPGETNCRAEPEEPAAHSDGSQQQSATATYAAPERPARVGRPRGTGKQKVDEEVVSVLVDLVNGGMNRRQAILRLVDQGKLPDDESTENRMYRRLRERLGPANGDK